MTRRNIPNRKDMKFLKYLIMLCVAACATYVIEGDSRIIDGDTIKVGTEKIRLTGIDAPETAQTCKCNGKKTFCGKEATQALKDFIGDDEIFCNARKRDGYGRLLGTCFIERNGEKIDLNRWMVQNGHAVAYRNYSKAYVPEEDEARELKKGVWACKFQMPWDYRKSKRGRKR